jgi:uncharacterized protein YehS (DUF1456 family)
MMALFAMGGKEVTRAEISSWLKKDDDPDFTAIYDKDLAIFLNGLIIDKRGKKDGEIPVPEKRLNNNIILRKLKIALDMKDVDILETLDVANFDFSKHELSALFRKPSHPHFRACKDQILRVFLQGLLYQHHPDKKPI